MSRKALAELVQGDWLVLVPSTDIIGTHRAGVYPFESLAANGESVWATRPHPREDATESFNAWLDEHHAIGFDSKSEADACLQRYMELRARFYLAQTQLRQSFLDSVAEIAKGQGPGEKTPL